MKLREFKQLIDECVKRAGECDPDVEVHFKKACYDVRRIGQFGVVPDVVISIGEKIYEDPFPDNIKAQARRMVKRIYEKAEVAQSEKTKRWYDEVAKIIEDLINELN